MAANSRWLAYAFCGVFLAACGGNDENDLIDTGDAPTLSDITDKSTPQDTATAAIPFTIDDGDTDIAALTLSGSSSNTTLVPNANIVFGGSGANRTVTVTPAAGQTGTATITVNVSDGDQTTSDTFVLTVTSSGSSGTFGSPDDAAKIAASFAGVFSSAASSATGKAAHPKVAVPCPGGGTLDFTGNDTTDFAADGTIVFDGCTTTDEESGAQTVEDGQLVFVCTDEEQSQNTCGNNEDFDFTFGTAQNALSLEVANDDTDVTGDFFGLTVSGTDDGDDDTRTFSVDGRMKIAGDCGSGDFNVDTVDALIADADDGSLTAGEMNLTSNTDDSEANLVFHADKSVTVTVDGVGQTYTQDDLEDLCHI